MISASVLSAIQFAKKGQYANALPLLDQALTMALRGAACTDDHAAIEKILRDHAPLLPSVPTLRIGWTLVSMRAGTLETAIDLLDLMFVSDPAPNTSPGQLTTLLRQIDDTDLRCELLRGWAGKRPSNAGLLRHLAQALAEIGELEESRLALEQLAALHPGDPYPHTELGRLAVALGDVAQARASFRAAISLEPGYAAATWELAQLDGWTLDAPAVARVETQCRKERDPKSLAGLHAILARCSERAGDHAAAARHAGITNTLMAATAGTHGYDPASHRAEVDTALEEFTPELMHRLKNSGLAAARPAFIIGLPRSGTTLLERMLASHPQVAGVGELPLAIESYRRALAASGPSPSDLQPHAVATAAATHFAKLENHARRLSLDASALRIVDKMPDNYRLTGWLRLMFPRSTIIHCLRDPRDVAISCWTTQFADVPWSYSLEHITQRVEQHRRLMRHWRTLPAMNLLELRYEDLIRNPECALRRLLEAMDLDWSADVLDFAGRGGYVASASRQQVREPLHDRGIGRWRHYEQAMHKILPRLEAIAEMDAHEMETLRVPTAQHLIDTPSVSAANA